MAPIKIPPAERSEPADDLYGRPRAGRGGDDAGSQRDSSREHTVNDNQAPRNPLPRQAQLGDDDRVMIAKAQARKIFRPVLWAFGAITVLGAISSVGQNLGEQTSPHPALTAPPPKIIEHTVTRTVTVPARLPEACRNYIAELDTAAKGVYAYQRAVDPESDILSQGLQAMVDQDPHELNRVRTTQTSVENDTATALSTIVASDSLLKSLRAACQREIGGH